MKQINITTQLALAICWTALLSIACGPEPVQDPESMQGKQALLQDLLAKRQSLNKEIADLRKTIIEDDPQMKKRAKTVTLDTIATGNFEKYLTVQGNVEAGDIVKAVPEMGGRILSIPVREGDYVKKGQIIARLDGEAVDKQIAELRTSLALATTVYERQERLWNQNIGSEIQYLEAKSNKERLEKTIETVKFQKSKAAVYAPISGIVNKEYSEVGEVAPAGMPILEILNTRQVKVVADLPENYLGIIDKGDQVDIKFPALAQNTTGRVSLVGRTIDPANRTFKIEVELPNKSNKLKPNLLAEIKLRQDQASDVIRIPLELVQEDVSGTVYVYTAIKDGERYIAQRNDVTMGNGNEGMVIIEDGLQPGAALIIDGARLVKDGEEILVKS